MTLSGQSRYCISFGGRALVIINNIYSFSRINRRSVPFVKMFLRSGIIQQMHLFLSLHQKLTSALWQGTL